MKWYSACTENCVICHGPVGHCWSVGGHVLLGVSHILATKCANPACREVKFNEAGCYGRWTTEMGLIVREGYVDDTSNPTIGKLILQNAD